MTKLELLCPAGNMECLSAAIENGADSIYLGLRSFGARSFCGNFSIDELHEAVRIAHSKGVKVYLTMNTLVKNHEIQDYFQQLSQAYTAGIDAVIIQEISFLPIIKKSFPGLCVHISTQANVHNSAMASLLKDADMVTLARELSAAQITHIKEETGARLEMFCHGALCVSFSGQCLMSSFIGGRSGNRGKCAQPCRKRYNGRYLLSTKDLCLIGCLPEIIRSGVDVIKIEGRMRSAEYVAAVTGIYRQAIDRYYSDPQGFSVSREETDRLMLAFNREFTEGYFRSREDIISPQKPMNRGLLIGKVSERGIIAKCRIAVGDGISVWHDDDVSGYYIEEIIMDGNRVSSAQVGDTIEIRPHRYAHDDLLFKTSEKEPIAAARFTSRPAMKTPERISRTIKIPETQIAAFTDRPNICVKVYSLSDLAKAVKAKADIVYYDILAEDATDAKGIVSGSCTKLYLSTPRIMYDEDIPIILDRIKAISPHGIMAGNIGLLKHPIEQDLHVDYSANVFNDLDLRFLSSIARKQVLPIISPELNLEELRAFRDKRFSVLSDGLIVLMATKAGINAKELQDETGACFKIRSAHSCKELLNSKRLGLFSITRELRDAGIRYLYLDLDANVDKTIRIYRKILSDQPFDDRKIRKKRTAGHIRRGVL